MNEPTNSGELPARSKAQLRFDKLFHEAIENRKVACFWNNGDWEDRWELQDQYALPTAVDDSSESYRSNVRSPEISGRIQSAMHKLSKMNIAFVVRPKNSAAKLAARVDELVVNHFFADRDFRGTLRDAFYTAVVHGSAPLGVEWLKRSRKVKQVLTNPEEMSEKQKKQAKAGEVPYVEVEQIDFNTPVLINYTLQSVYLDPAARNMQGAIHNCGHAFVAELITYESFKSTFEGKEGFKDVDKVKPISKDWTTPAGNEVHPERYLYPPISGDGEYVYVVKGWDYYNDEYKIKANEIYIKESPLPYSDKKIPLEILKPYTLPNQVYGVGMVDLLIPSVYQLELIQNAFYDWLLYTINPILLIQRNDYGDFSRKYQLVNGEPGAMLPVTDVMSSVAPLKFPNLSIDVFQGIGLLQKDAILASQHDPNQLGVLRKDATATANIINKEVAEAFVNYIVDNFTGTLENVARMLISRIHEFMTKPQVSKLVNGETVEGEPFEVAIPGKYVDVDWDERVVKVENNPERVSLIKISKKLYEYEDPKTGELIQVTPNDYEVALSAESKQIISRALEQQRMIDSAKIIMPYAVNPNDPQATMKTPLQLFNAIEWADQFVDVMGLSPKILLNQSENEKSDIKRAEEQNAQMYEGKRAVPKAGESATHVKIHTDFQHMLINELETMKVDIESSIRAGIQVTPEQQQRFDRIRRVLPIVSEHIDFDTTNVVEEAALVSRAGMMIGGNAQQPPQQQQQAPQEQGPGVGQSVSQSGMGADSGLPNVPRQAGFTQGGAGPLTKM